MKFFLKRFKPITQWHLMVSPSLHGWMDFDEQTQGDGGKEILFPEMGSWYHHRKEFKDTPNKPSKQWVY